MAINIDVSFNVSDCDDCLFYFYSDLRDYCVMLKKEIPYEKAVEGIHPQYPFLKDKTRYETYWNERRIVVWDNFDGVIVVSTDEVSELQKNNCKIITWMLNKNDKIFESV